jgi:ribosomal protein S27E
MKRIKLRCPKGHTKTVGLECAGTDVKCDECGHVWHIPAIQGGAPARGGEEGLKEKLARAEAEIEKLRLALRAKDDEVEELRRRLGAGEKAAPSAAPPPPAPRPAGEFEKTAIIPAPRADLFLDVKPAASASDGPPDLERLRAEAKKASRPEGVEKTQIFPSPVLASLMEDEKAAPAGKTAGESEAGAAPEPIAPAPPAEPAKL